MYIVRASKTEPMVSWTGLIALAMNFPLNLGVTLSNKSFFKYLSFSLPVTLGAIHMLFCAVLPFVRMPIYVLLSFFFLFSKIAYESTWLLQ